MAAPSGVNKQPWEFVLIDDKDILKSLADSLPYAKMTAQAPMVIAVCDNSARFLEGDDSTLWVQDVSAASENILLAAHALGLGGYPIKQHASIDKWHAERVHINGY